MGFRKIGGWNDTNLTNVFNLEGVIESGFDGGIFTNECKAIVFFSCQLKGYSYAL
jgi:hypothetical protein